MSGTQGSRHERRGNVPQFGSVQVREHRVDLRLVWSKEERDLSDVDATGRTLGPNSLTRRLEDAFAQTGHAVKKYRFQQITNTID